MWSDSDRRAETGVLRAVALAVIAFSISGPGCGGSGPATGALEPPTRLLLTPCETLLSVGSDDYDSVYSIDGFQLAEEGLFVLDCAGRRVVRLDPGGEWTFFGESGEGPGCLLNPVSFVVSGGTVRVIDAALGTVCFSTDGEYLSDRSFFAANLPVALAASAGGGHVGLIAESSINEHGDLEAQLSVCLFQDGAEPVATLEGSSITLDPMDVSNSLYEALTRYRYASDLSSGVVYVSRTEPDLVSIRGYDCEGQVVFEFCENAQPVRVTDIEASQGSPMASGPLLRNRVAEVSPGEYLPQVSELGIDSLGNLWVRLGTEAAPTFLVISTATEEVLYEAVASGLDSESSLIETSVTPYGILVKETDEWGNQELYRIRFVER
ncbi:hypothetical protein JW921_02645 [Candidatus Fermentibacterales bacterium]|nr:hypothetical protein [Candidatus Fermentibacterales bacterium]